MRIAVIGGGAAGFFAAVTAAKIKNNSVFIFEKTGKVLSKVKVSGGGRCNVTHACFDSRSLVDHYPRGNKELRNAFHRFNVNNTVEWFEARGVKLKAEHDGRMFPVTDNSSTIINCLMSEAGKHGVSIIYNSPVEKIIRNKSGFELTSGKEIFSFDKVIVTSGGSPSQANYNWLTATGHTIIPPAPSLFTFNIPLSPLKGLEGVSVTNAAVRIKDFKRSESGPVLITHWGISGPAVIKLSAWSARVLKEKNYETEVYINWLPSFRPDSLIEEFLLMKKVSPTRKVAAASPFEIPNRLWERICSLSGISDQNYADLSRQMMNKLTGNLNNFTLLQKGKTTYKEEFVTCGGITLKEVNMQTMESKLIPGLFFAGEVLDIDGVTGGFNFQAAWTTGFIAGS